MQFSYPGLSFHADLPTLVFPLDYLSADLFALWISCHGFIRCMGYSFLSCGSVYGWLSFGFLPYLVCSSEVTDDVHQGIAACTSFVFFLRVAYLYMRLSLFLSIRFRSLRFGASNDFICDSLPN